MQHLQAQPPPGYVPDPYEVFSYELARLAVQVNDVLMKAQARLITDWNELRNHEVQMAKDVRDMQSLQSVGTMSKVAKKSRRAAQALPRAAQEHPDSSSNDALLPAAGQQPVPAQHAPAAEQPPGGVQSPGTSGATSSPSVKPPPGLGGVSPGSTDWACQQDVGTKGRPPATAAALLQLLESAAEACPMAGEGQAPLAAEACPKGGEGQSPASSSESGAAAEAARQVPSTPPPKGAGSASAVQAEAGVSHNPKAEEASHGPSGSQAKRASKAVAHGAATPQSSAHTPEHRTEAGSTVVREAEAGAPKQLAEDGPKAAAQGAAAPRAPSGAPSQAPHATSGGDEKAHAAAKGARRGEAGGDPDVHSTSPDEAPGPKEGVKAAHMRGYLEGTWEGEKGETYEICFSGGQIWQCTRRDQHSQKRYTVRWMAEHGHIRWGHSYYLDPAQLRERPEEARWHNMDRHAKPSFVWKRCGAPPRAVLPQGQGRREVAGDAPEAKGEAGPRGSAGARPRGSLTWVRKA